MMEAVSIFETLVNFYEITCYNFQVDSHVEAVLTEICLC
jgi:hypothetical protein